MPRREPSLGLQLQRRLDKLIDWEKEAARASPGIRTSLAALRKLENRCAKRAKFIRSTAEAGRRLKQIMEKDALPENLQEQAADVATSLELLDFTADSWEGAAKKLGELRVRLTQLRGEESREAIEAMKAMKEFFAIALPDFES